MSAHAVTYAFLVPTQMRKLLALPNTGSLLFPSLRVLVSSGTFLHPGERAEIRRRLSPNLFDMHSSTESGGITALHPGDPDEKQASVGRPNTNVSVQVVDATDTMRPAGKSAGSTKTVFSISPAA